MNRSLTASCASSTSLKSWLSGGNPRCCIRDLSFDRKRRLGRRLSISFSACHFSSLFTSRLYNNRGSFVQYPRGVRPEWPRYGRIGHGRHPEREVVSVESAPRFGVRLDAARSTTWVGGAARTADGASLVRHYPAADQAARA